MDQETKAVHPNTWYMISSEVEFQEAIVIPLELPRNWLPGSWILDIFVSSVPSGWIVQSSHVNDSPEFYVLGHGICKTGMEMGVAYSKVWLDMWIIWRCWWGELKGVKTSYGGLTTTRIQLSHAWTAWRLAFEPNRGSRLCSCSTLLIKMLSFFLFSFLCWFSF